MKRAVVKSFLLERQKTKNWRKSDWVLKGRIEEETKTQRTEGK
jgi:hypothetical protein